MARDLFQYHPTIGYLFIPRLQARVRHEAGGYLLRTNSAGFRCGHEFRRERREGHRRVLLFGDSYTAGDGVSDGRRYGDLLEQLRPDLEVFNYGLPGTGTDQHYLVYRELAQDVEHDLIVIAVLVENIRRVAARHRPFQSRQGKELLLAKPFYSISDQGELELHHVPVPKKPMATAELPERDRQRVDRGGNHEWVRKAVNRAGPRVKDVVQRLTRYQPLPEYDDPRNPAWRTMKALLSQWASEATAPVVVMPVPLYQYVEETASAEGYRARFHELAADAPITLHDPLDDFQRFSPAERRQFRFERDCHLTPAAHRVLADSLRHLVDEKLPIHDTAGRGAG